MSPTSLSNPQPRGYADRAGGTLISRSFRIDARAQRLAANRRGEPLAPPHAACGPSSSIGT
jgi:hypothetical protein